MGVLLQLPAIIAGIVQILQTGKAGADAISGLFEAHNVAHDKAALAQAAIDLAADKQREQDLIDGK